MKENIGFCALCGTYGKLYYEHIPPRAAFNSKPVKMYTGTELFKNDSVLPWDVNGLTYINRQQGSGKFSLCRPCNNNTGSWYAREYQDIARAISYALQDPEITSYETIGIRDVYPLRFFKQIISMFCSVNDYKTISAYANPAQISDNASHHPLLQNIIDAQVKLHEAAIMMEDLRKFVLNRDVTGLDRSKFKVCMYLTKSSLVKLNGITSVLNMNQNTNNVVSEITAAPFGFVLHFNPFEDNEYPGVDITGWSDVGYNEKRTIEFPIQVLEMNSFFPGDYRSKEEIKSAIDENVDC